MSSLEFAVAQAAARAQRLEVHELSGRIERLRALLREHGIPMPLEDERLGESGQAHLEACQRVVIKAYELLEATAAFESSLADLRTLVGSGMELVGGERWR